MNLKFQRLKNSLYSTWYAEDVFFEESCLSSVEWEELNSNPSRYLNNFIQRWPMIKNSKFIEELPISQRIWKEREQHEAQRRLYRLIAISLPFTTSKVSQVVAMQLVDDVLSQFSSSILYFWPYYSFTYTAFEEMMVIVDPQKLLFVGRIEED